jgi:hypothetical protein
MTNEKRLAALAELQADGERMENSTKFFDLIEMKYPDGTVVYCNKAFKAGFNKAKEIYEAKIKELEQEIEQLYNEILEAGERDD